MSSLCCCQKYHSCIWDENYSSLLSLAFVMLTVSSVPQSKYTNPFLSLLHVYEEEPGVCGQK